jgi:hypothetical protein
MPVPFLICLRYTDNGVWFVQQANNVPHAEIGDITVLVDAVYVVIRDIVRFSDDTPEALCKPRAPAREASQCMMCRRLPLTFSYGPLRLESHPARAFCPP